MAKEFLDVLDLEDRQNYLSMASFPIFAKGEVFGACTISCDVPSQFGIDGANAIFDTLGGSSAYTYRQEDRMVKFKINLSKRKARHQAATTHLYEALPKVEVQTTATGRKYVAMMPKVFSATALRTRAARHRGFLKTRAKELTFATLDASEKP